MAEIGASQYIGPFTALISPASSIGSVSSDRGLFYTRRESSQVEESDYGESNTIVSRPVIPLPRAVSAQLVVYRMRGKDVDCPVLTYRYWNAIGAPDLSAALYTGPKCGGSALTEVKVVENTSS